MTLHPRDTLDLLGRLAHLGNARHRATEREPRTITITDDEALALVGLVSVKAMADLGRTPDRVVDVR
jgi:hypothetical protein